MTRKRDLTRPRQDGAVDQPDRRTEFDPVAIATGLVSDDPSLAELVAFRDRAPDRRFAARVAKRLANEAMRLRLWPHDHDAVQAIAAGLTLVSLGYIAAGAIWPSDTLDVVEAKRALAEVIGPFGHRQEADYVPTLSPELTTRLRIKCAAFAVGEMMVPAGPAAPSSCDRGLADWPLKPNDLTSVLPPRVGPPVFANTQAQVWARLLDQPSHLGRLAERVERLLATADRLVASAQVLGDGAAQLQRAAEGALIVA